MSYSKSINPLGKATMPDSPRPKKKQKTGTPLRDLCKSFVTVKVGKESEVEDFLLHKELLRSKSRFFKAALSGAWEEGKTGIVTMPEEDPDVFSLFQTWLYTSKLSFDSIVEPETVEGKTRIAVEVILFGDRNGVDGFHDKGIDVLMDSMKDNMYGPGFVHHVYDNTTTEATIRTCLSHAAARLLKNRLYSDRFAMMLDQYPFDFTKEVVKIYFEATSGLGTFQASLPSDYYVEKP